jgi:hypothetical protein
MIFNVKAFDIKQISHNNHPLSITYKSEFFLVIIRTTQATSGVRVTPSCPVEHLGARKKLGNDIDCFSKKKDMDMIFDRSVMITSNDERHYKRFTSSLPSLRNFLNITALPARASPTVRLHKQRPIHELNQSLSNTGFFIYTSCPSNPPALKCGSGRLFLLYTPLHRYLCRSFTDAPYSMGIASPCALSDARLQ